MLELINLSNDKMQITSLFNDNKKIFNKFLIRHNIKGIELIFGHNECSNFFKEDEIVGVHLCFWPTWIDFWQENNDMLLSKFGNNISIRDYFLAENKNNWLKIWEHNIKQAISVDAEYVVFHISESPIGELYSRFFARSDESVIDASIELLNIITINLPAKCKLLLENLWWPGLTLQKPRLMEKLLTNLNHPNVGFMLDTGHLMNTNCELKNECDAVKYIIDNYKKLGCLQKYIIGLHLHCSISGEYTKQMMREHHGQYWPQGWYETSKYISNVDQHQPFKTDNVIRILDTIRPNYLVHEFISNSIEDLEYKVSTQRHSLGFK